MKFTIKKEDIKQYKEKYGNQNAVGGYAEQLKLLRIPLPKFYIMILDDESLTFVQLNMKLEEKSIESFPLTDILSISVKGFPFNRVVIKAKDKNFNLMIRPYTMGIEEDQKELREKLDSISI